MTMVHAWKSPAVHGFLLLAASMLRPSLAFALLPSSPPIALRAQPILALNPYHVPVSCSQFASTVLCRQHRTLSTQLAGTTEDSEGDIPVDFWCLVKGDGPVPREDLEVCKRLLQAHKAKDSDGFAEALATAETCNLAVELKPKEASHRTFQFPNTVRTLRSVTVRETTFGEGGLGYSIWDAGTALSIWLTLNKSRVQGKKVLELGSGVGLAGIVANQCGAKSTVLTDFGQPVTSNNDVDARGGAGSAEVGKVNSVVAEGLQPAQLLSNLEYNIGLNALAADCPTQRLDWHACLLPDFQCEEYEVVVGSDVIYYEEDAEALLAAVTRHTAPDASFFLMNRRERPGLKKVLAGLEAAGRVEVEELSLVSNLGSTPLLFAHFQPS